jgi:hypothetical protein
MSKQLRKLVVPVIILALTSVCAYTFFLYSPQLVWDKSPQTLVVHTEVGVRHIDYRYIPDFRLWGDGRVIWVKHFPDGERKVFEGFLSENDIFNILEKLKDAGFFKTRFPFVRKENPDCGYQGFEDAYMHIHLIRNTYIENAWTNDRKICDAINNLVTATEIVGHEYIPTEGKLYFVPIEKTDIPQDTQEVYVWSDADFPFRPEAIAASDKSGMVITGQALRLAWDIANRSSQPVVVSNGKKFWMAVTIKGISTVY